MKYTMLCAGSIIDLNICDEIWSGSSCSAQYVRDTLAANPKATLIRVRFNSVGGDVNEGLDIYRSLVDHPARVEGYITGLAASIASVILCACDHVRMAKGAQVMIHNPYGGVMGDAQTHRSLADSLDNATKDLIVIYQARTGKSYEDLLALLAKETYFDCDAAVVAGFADEIIPAKVANRELATLQIESLKSPPDLLSRMVARARSKPLDPQICQVLGIGEDATLQDIITAIMSLKEAMADKPAADPGMSDDAPPAPPAADPKKKPAAPGDDEMAAAVAALDPKVQAKILALHTKATSALDARLTRIENETESRELATLVEQVPANLKAWAKKQKAAVVRDYVATAGIAPVTSAKEPILGLTPQADDYSESERAVAKATGISLAQVRKDRDASKGSK